MVALEIIAWGVLGGAISAGVIAAWLLRHYPRDADVDELIAAVKGQVNEQRRERMRSVRRGETEHDAAPPRELTTRALPAGLVVEDKETLRKRVFGGMRSGGNP